MSDESTPGAPPALSERGSMIWPVGRDRLAALGALPEHLVIGAARFTRKAEHHVTVLNYGIGKHIAKLAAARPALKAAIDAAAAEHPWTLEPGDVFYHLVQNTPGREPLSTIVVLVDAPIAAFYEQLAGIVESGSGGDPSDPGAAELLTGLGAPPPPHVTLYTSDPGGKAGIGLNTAAELGAAAALAAKRVAHRGDSSPGLRAYRLPPDVVRLAT